MGKDPARMDCVCGLTQTVRGFSVPRIKSCSNKDCEICAVIPSRSSEENVHLAESKEEAMEIYEEWNTR